MTISDYSQIIESTLRRHWAVDDHQLKLKTYSSTSGKLIGKIILADRSYIDFSEEIFIEKHGLDKTQYRYEYVKNKTEIFRYDNFPKHPGIPSPFHHKHASKGVIQIESAPKLIDIIEEAARFLF